METNPHSRRQAFLIFLLVVVPLLLFLGWSQASLNLSFIHPRTAQETILLLALSALIFVAFVIFALILLRILLKLHAERRERQLGSQFKTKLVAAFLGLSLLPVCFLFVFAYGLLNRSIDKWFSIPFDTLRKDASEISQLLDLQAEQRTLDDSAHLAADTKLRDALGRKDTSALTALLAHQVVDLRLSSAMCFDRSGHLLARAGISSPGPAEATNLFPALASGAIPAWGTTARWRFADSEAFLAARQVENARGAPSGTVVSVRRLPLDMEETAGQIQQEAKRYDALSQEQRAVKRIDLSILGLVTLLILFAATWLAMFISKQVTVPIQALAEGTHQVSQGNLGFQVSAPASGELATLIGSFNEMTRQLQESRRAIEQATRELQTANRTLEERGNTIEAIVENIPTGVISLDPQGEVTKINSTAVRLLGCSAGVPTGVGGAGDSAAPGARNARVARKLADLFSAEDAHEISLLLRRAARQGVVTRQGELDLGGHRAVVALTVSSVRARHGNVGYVLVLEDLTELLRAQKSAAWREVAQRLAHEIKNPLTPLQLSAERIQRLIERAGVRPLPRDLAAAVAESSALIGREVANLKALVDEFSNFARFPASQPVSSDLNAIVESALRVFDRRLDGIRVYRELAAGLPAVQADPEQMKRALVNLIDNAAEAMAHSPLKEVAIRTALDPDRDVVELVVADSGPGISPETKEKLFLPYFSTKRRGTGLGLAIVSRIISEHRGFIRVEENRPSGAKFIIELPAEHAAMANAEL